MAQSERVSRTFKLAEDVMGVRKPIARVSKKLVVFDLMGTLLWGPKGYREHLVNFYREVGKLQGVLKRDIENAIGRVRRRLSSHDIPPNMYWPFVNAMILQELDKDRFEDMSLSQLAPLGEEIHRRYLSEHDRFDVHPNMRGVLTHLRSHGVPMCIGSNQDIGKAEKLIAEKGLAEYFSAESWFVSERLGVWKPNLEFLRKIAGLYNLTAEEVVYVGNSVNNDVPLVKSGCTVVLIDHDGRHRHRRSRSRSVLREYGEYRESGILRIDGSMIHLEKFLNRAIDPSARLARPVRS